MSAPEFTMRQLIEAGVHYGHQAHRWNPLMAEYIHSKRNGIHIIDLTRTVPMLDAALKIVSETVAGGGSILFVGTKRQAQEPIKEAARASAQFYINQRWLGGTLTNWKTVSNSIKRLNSIDEQLETGIEGLTKKELLGMRREQAKLHASLGGIREMRGLPSMLFVIDVNKEAIAIAEAAKLGIPVAAVVDSNCPPENIDYLIPGNDDASRAIALYCDLMSRAAIAGLQQEIRERGKDLGESDEMIQQTDSMLSIESGNSKAERDSQAGIAEVQDTIPEQGPSTSSEEPPQTET
ncbi:MAG: 30S ribosomal protein S2, partial [Rhodobacteraceae bacterium]|nr:30S ribosomal protein S2 [Paracoccaceae bacterium]